MYARFVSPNGEGHEIGRILTVPVRREVIVGSNARRLDPRAALGAGRETGLLPSSPASTNATVIS